MRRNTIKQLILYILILWAIPAKLAGIQVEELTFHGPKNLETEQELLKYYFNDLSSVMYAIAMCESTRRQFDENGTPLISNTNDAGYFQINIKTWDEKAQELGLDYKYSLKDNIQMAKYVLDYQGLTAWTVYNNGCYKRHL